MRLASLSPAQREALDRMLAGRGPAPAAGPITRRTGRLDLPLSFAQQRIWFFDRLRPGAGIYNIAGSARLRGRLDVDVLRRSIDEVVRRHEVLRTTYHLEDNRPVQRVNPARPILLPIVELSSADRLPEAGTAAAAEPFDLERDQFLRPVLVRLAPEEHVLLLSQHHIATDGWSLGILLAELGVLYRAFATGQPSPLPQLPLQYGDFAQWQRTWLAGPELLEKVGYWQRQLAGAPLLDLPPGRARPPVRSWDGDSVPFEVPRALARRLRELGDSQRATLYMVLLAAFTVVASRWSGQRDVVVGAPVANRNRPEIEGLIGCFVNTLPLRVRVPAGATFRELLAVTRDVCVAGYDNQDVPFDRIVEAVNPERTASAATPLVRHMFGLHNTRRTPLDLPDLRIELAGVNTGKARFDLEFELSPADDGVEGVVWFAVEVFTKQMVTGLANSLTAVLRAVADDADTPVSLLPLASHNERAESKPVATGLLDAIESVAAETPDVVAVGTTTYRELVTRSARLAGYLQELGASPEQPVATRLRRPEDRVVALLAVLRAGCVHQPEEPAALTITEKVYAAGVAGKPTVPRRFPPPMAGAMLSSRGELVTHAGLAGLVGRLSFDRRSGRTDTVLVQVPPQSEEWPSGVLWALAAGSRLVLPEQHDPVLLPADGVTVAYLATSAVPTVTAKAVGLSHVVGVGEHPWPELVESLRHSLPDAVISFPHGNPAAGATMVVLDDNWQPVPDGACGELCFGGDPVPRGLMGRPAETAVRLVPDPRSPGGRLWRTGELVRYTPEDGLVFLGACADRTFVDGHPLTTGEVREAIEAHPSVGRAVVRRLSGGETVAYVGLTARPVAEDRWRDSFERAYLERATQHDPGLAVAGWTSPRTGRYLGEAELKEWSDATVRRVLDLAPRRVVEVGCRTGLLLFRVAPRCETYHGVDLSANALAHNNEHRDWLAGKADSVRLSQAAPDDLGEISDHSADLVVLNSIVQYCPTAGYLETVIREAMRVVAPGGTVLITDVRDARLEQAELLAGLRRDPPAGATEDHLVATAAHLAAAEDELVPDPLLFRLIGDRVPGIAAVTVLARAGRSRTELSTHRYDVLLRAAGGPDQPEDIRWLPPATDLSDLDRLGAALRGAGGVAVGLRGVPDARVADLLKPAADSTPAIDPADVAAAASSLGRSALFAVDLDGGPGTLVVVLRPGSGGTRPYWDPAARRPEGTPADYANNPERAAHTAATAVRVQAYLRERLADHQRPTHLVFVGTWPVGDDGRLDPAALPLPCNAVELDTGTGSRERDEPRTDLERGIAEIWSEVLGLEHVGIKEDFFALGGHSLMAAEVIDRIRDAYSVDVPLGKLFETPTVAEVAEYVTQVRAAPEVAAGPIRRADRGGRRSRPVADRGA